jgi:hypothetical protein
VRRHEPELGRLDDPAQPIAESTATRARTRITLRLNRIAPNEAIKVRTWSDDLRLFYANDPVVLLAVDGAERPTQSKTGVRSRSG